MSTPADPTGDARVALSTADIRALALQAGFKVWKNGDITAADCPQGIPVPHSGCATRSLERFTRLLEARFAALPSNQE